MRCNAGRQRQQNQIHILKNNLFLPPSLKPPSPSARPKFTYQRWLHKGSVWRPCRAARRAISKCRTGSIRAAMILWKRTKEMEENGKSMNGDGWYGRNERYPTHVRIKCKEFQFHRSTAALHARSDIKSDRTTTATSTTRRKKKQERQPHPRVCLFKGLLSLSYAKLRRFGYANRT